MALLAAPAARALLFGLQPSDPKSITLAIVLVMAISATASMAPALRAAHLDPLEALRDE